MRIYAVREDDKKRILVEIQCDSCDARIKPNPLISQSGWIKKGMYHGHGADQLEWHYCPSCA